MRNLMHALLARANESQTHCRMFFERKRGRGRERRVTRSRNDFDRETDCSKLTSQETPMNILLLSMPDSFEHMAPVAIRIPNGALASLAGNVDRHHRVAIAALILVQGRVGPTVARLLQELKPDVVGLS